MLKNTIALLLVSSTYGRVASMDAEDDLQADSFESYES
jgi:hypothetical protein